ncbi:MAG: hypothetical protein IT286_04210, partial [Proteobacteria bacterium]|nr:hypothetical protein [Pseudomonadota bacterium]
MNFTKTLALGVIMMQTMLSSCAKIDKFDAANMLEGFTGVIKVTPGIEGITARNYTPGIVFFNGNKDGTEVILYGPMTEPFSIYSILPEGDNQTQFRNEMKRRGVSSLDKLDFSGFRGKVDPNDGKKIKFYGFGSQSKGMEKFNWKVEGTGLIDGPDSHVQVRIYTDVKTLKELLPR